MSPLVVALLLFVLMLGLMAIRVPIAAAMFLGVLWWTYNELPGGAWLDKPYAERLRIEPPVAKPAAQTPAKVAINERGI